MSIVKKAKTILLIVCDLSSHLRYLKKIVKLVLRQNKLISRIENNENAIYLTFDDGPDDGITQFVLDQLRMYSAKATFFCCGRSIEKNYHLLEMIKAEGHAIGCHTYTHQRGLSTDYKEYCQEVISFCRKYKTRLFRPPYGSISDREILQLAFRYKIILWSEDSSDWEAKKNDAFDVEELFGNVTAGAIVLFHFSNEHQYRTRLILPAALEYLDQKGFNFHIIEY